MANACLVVDNNALNGSVGASSQALTMPASNLLTPHPSERWRALSNSAWFVLDKGAAIAGDTVIVKGLTAGPNATARLRLSSIDATGDAGDVFDSGPTANGTTNFDLDYGAFVARLPSPSSWRYARFDIADPDKAYVEAGCILDGLSEMFEVNFSKGSGSTQYVDRSRVSQTSSGITLIWPDNDFRRIDISFGLVKSDQRYGLVERLDRVAGRRKNVLLITEPDAVNLPRVSFFGLVTDVTPVTYGPIFELFGKQLQIDERI